MNKYWNMEQEYEVFCPDNKTYSVCVQFEGESVVRLIFKNHETGKTGTVKANLTDLNKSDRELYEKQKSEL